MTKYKDMLALSQIIRVAGNLRLQAGALIRRFNPLASLKESARPDRRELTLMIVPHHCTSVFRLRFPVRIIKAGAVVGCILLLVLAGALLDYRNTVKAANAEKEELARLRSANAVQSGQIEELAKVTALLQDDMTKLNKLDNEIRRLVNNDETAAPSRSGVSRSGAAGGQGGPVVKPSAAELTQLVQDLQKAAKDRERSLVDLKQAVIDRNARIAATPSIWPTDGYVTSRFGWRSSPGGWGSSWHPGIDIADDYGSPIYATADGVVIFSSWYYGYGLLVQIDHGNGIVTLYGHNSENLVRVGQYVKKGDQIAEMGSTGISTGTHLHYEVRVNGNAVNPEKFL